MLLDEKNNYYVITPNLIRLAPTVMSNTKGSVFLEGLVKYKLYSNC